MAPPTTALVKTSPIPTPTEVIKDLIKHFGTKYGLDLVEAVFAEPEYMKKLREGWGKKTAPSGGGGGGALVLLGVLAIASKSKRRGRR